MKAQGFEGTARKIITIENSEKFDSHYGVPTSPILNARMILK